jgi:kynurenine formamidase
MGSIQYSRVIELSHPIYPGIPIWPGDPPVEFSRVASLEQDGFFLRRFAIGEHSATHLNAPAAFFDEGSGVEAYPPQRLVLPAVVIDLRPRCTANPDAALSVAEVLDWEHKHERVPTGSLVILSTGWAEKWGDPQAFLNIDHEGVLHFPGFGVETASFLLDERQAGGVGIDTHGVDRGADSRYEVNRQVLGCGGLVLECLARLNELPPTGATLVIGRLPLAGGSGSPVSVLAFVP